MYSQLKQLVSSFLAINQLHTPKKACLCRREFPQIDGFIKQQLSLYSNVQISYRWGFSPRLVLKFSDKQKETIRIDSWTTDNIVEYLDDRIVKSKVVIGTS